MTRSVKPVRYGEQAARAPLFYGVEAEQVERLLALDGVGVRHYAAGETIYSPDGFERCLGFVVSGSARVVKDCGTGAMPMSVLRAGELFGAAALFTDGESYVADIRAESSTWAVLIPQSALEEMMRLDLRIAKNYIAYLTARIRFLSARLDGFVPPTVEERVLSYVRANARDGAFRPAHGLSAVADALRISRATLYRAFDALQAQGKLYKDGKTLYLPETAGLKPPCASARVEI